MAFLPEDAALVCFVEGQSPDEIVCGFYLDGRTCLNQIERIARFIPSSVTIAVFYEHSEAKWRGRGQRVNFDPVQTPAVSRKRKPKARDR